LQGQPNWRERKADGRLPAPPHDDTGHTWHHSDEQLFRITKLGMTPPIAPEGYDSDMPAFGDTLKDEEIWAVLSFIKSTWSVESRVSQERIDQAFRNQAEKQ
jgi:mono/diheme cytochrome c family protein